MSFSTSGMAASASATNTSGGSCSGRFRRLQKCSFHCDTTDARLDTRLPSAAFSGADGTVLLGLRWRNLVKASLISLLQRHCSPSRAIHSAHCCLSCLSARRRGPARRLYCSTSPARTACLRCSTLWFKKNAPTLADYNYDPVHSILIIFSKLFVNDHKSCLVVKFSTSPHICCHYTL